MLTASPQQASRVGRLGLEPPRLVWLCAFPGDLEHSSPEFGLCNLNYRWPTGAFPGRQSSPTVPTPTELLDRLGLCSQQLRLCSGTGRSHTLPRCQEIHAFPFA